MLTPRQNLLETIKGGHPDRYVNQFEALKCQWCTPIDLMYPMPEYGGEPQKSHWGITWAYPEGTPGFFPMTDEAHVLIKDITKWKEVVKMPPTEFPMEDWGWIIEEAEKVDREQYFCTAAIAPGIFETCHSMMGMEECMINLYEEPELMHELIDFILQYELKLAENICNYIKPDALYHHDDWGSQTSSFMSPEMFREFLVEPYKKLYGYYKEHGVQVIVHHSDSYLENLVPEMIDIGIDIWQGTMSTNDIPKILKQYGGQISVMGGIDNGKIDREDWTKEKVCEEVDKICAWCGTKYFIPDMTIGDEKSTYPGVYEAVSEEIEKLSKKYF